MNAPAAIEAALRGALALHGAGRISEARAAYEAVLARAPDQPDALHLLGTLLVQLGRPTEAVPLIERAVRRLPRSAVYRSHLADALAACGRGGEAEASWREAVRLAPNDAEANFNLAGHLAQAGRWREAEPLARRAVGLLPNSVPARFRLGLVLEALGRSSDALAQFRSAARGAPLERDIHRRVLATAMAAAEPAIAWRAVQRGAVLKPDAADNFIAVEAIGRTAGDSAEKSRWARRGAVAAPDVAFIRAIAAGYGIDRHDCPGALDEARRAIMVGPDAVLGYTARARAAQIVPRFDVSRQIVRWGLCLAPTDAELTYQYAQVEKASGDLARGWALEENRVRSVRFHRTAALPARWGGPGTDAGRLLVATEQGIGDELLFMSCLPDLLNDVSNPVVELDARLHPLFLRSFPGIELVPRQAFRFEGGRVVFDYTRVRRECGISHYIHAGSLPGLYRADRDRPATRKSYLVADPVAVAAWRERLDALGPEPKVGICWRSVVASAIRTNYYAPLAAWERVVRVPGIRFVALQYDECRAELAAIRERTGVDVWLPDGLDQMDDLDGTAALIAALDAVVSAPTSVCMAAAALGVSTLRVAPSTYFIGKTHDHFFPTMRPLAPWGLPMDLAKALAHAAEMLPATLSR